MKISKYSMKLLSIATLTAKWIFLLSNVCLLLILPVFFWLENAAFFNNMSLPSKEKSYQQKQYQYCRMLSWKLSDWKLKKKERKIQLKSILPVWHTLTHSSESLKLLLCLYYHNCMYCMYMPEMVWIFKFICSS